MLSLDLTLIHYEEPDAVYTAGVVKFPLKPDNFMAAFLYHFKAFADDSIVLNHYLIVEVTEFLWWDSLFNRFL